MGTSLVTSRQLQAWWLTDKLLPNLQLLRLPLFFTTQLQSLTSDDFLVNTVLLYPTLYAHYRISSSTSTRFRVQQYIFTGKFLRTDLGEIIFGPLYVHVGLLGRQPTVYAYPSRWRFLKHLINFLLTCVAFHLGLSLSSHFPFIKAVLLLPPSLSESALFTLLTSLPKFTTPAQKNTFTPPLSAAFHISSPILFAFQVQH